MLYTNNGGLPKPLHDVLVNNAYERAEGTISVTELIDSPRIRQLLQRHNHEIVKDVSSMVFALVGTGLHVAMSRYNKGVSEKRFYADYDGTAISGIPDLFEDEILYDYKTTSIWTDIFGVREEWKSQMNVYRWLLRKNDIVINKLSLIAIFRDWTLSQVSRRDDYPPYPAKVYDIPLWTLLETSIYVGDRVSLHNSAAQEPDDKLPECTPEERWQEDAVYAVYQDGQSKAKRVLPTIAEANNWIALAPKAKYNIVTRPEEWKRCEEYCDASQYCNMYKEYRDGSGNSVVEEAF